MLEVGGDRGGGEGEGGVTERLKEGVDVWVR